MSLLTLRFPQLPLDGPSRTRFQVADLADMLFNILNKWAAPGKPERFQGTTTTTIPMTRKSSKRPEPSRKEAEPNRPRATTLKERKFSGRRIVEFPNMKGRKLEKVEIYTSGERYSIVIAFQDRTFLNLAIEPGFTLHAVQEDRQPGDMKVLRRWPAIYSER